MALVPGTRLGTYEVIAPIGSGGMGEVYRAHDTNLRREVAIKVLPDALSRRSRSRRAFRTGGACGGGAFAPQHPLDSRLRQSTNGVRYAVTELLDGETLRDVMHGGTARAAKRSAK